ncbi:hypothetical protein RND71_009751 [Anisodus tanguticus]|uniref:Uncharacterized protein n=1 Tax=Anisodus tanguticus TaxID=243964 RepID=A0AAE1SIE9_9SOLA|nr:hypothetical protein RND71_009751 [Anisodus tanguticus]
MKHKRKESLSQNKQQRLRRPESPPKSPSSLNTSQIFKFEPNIQIAKLFKYEQNSQVRKLFKIEQNLESLIPNDVDNSQFGRSKIETLISQRDCAKLESKIKKYLNRFHEIYAANPE